MPSGSVPYLIQDRTGFLWFGTFSGIARYDGYDVVSYKHRSEDSTSISNAIVKALCDDNEGNLWVGHARGLDKLSRATDTFTHYVLNPQQPLTDWSNHVLALHEDRHGVLWVGTGNGLYMFNRATETFTWLRADSTDPHSLGHNAVNAIYEDRAGSLWFATGGGLDRFDRDAGKFIHYWHLPNNPYADPKTSDHWVLSILEDRDGILWLGTDGGIVEFDRQAETFTRYRHDPANPHSLANNTVLSICEDRSGLLWMSTKAGVDVLDKKSKRFSHYTHNEQDPGSLSSDDVGRILLERSGTIWISTYGGGVNKFTPSKSFLKKYAPEPGKTGSLPAAQIQDLVEDRTGVLWIATLKGLVRFDPETETFERYPPHEALYTVVEDREGTLWMSVRGGGLYRRDKRGGLSRFFDSSGREFREGVSTMCNGSDGKLWLGDLTGNLFRVDPVSRELTLVLHNTHWTDELREDRFGLVWLGTRDVGLLCYDPLQDTLSRFTSDSREPSSISGNKIDHIFEDKSGTLWIVANRALNKHNRSTRTFTRLGSEDGFPDDLFSFLEDDEGNYWMSTPKGTVKFDPRSKHSRSYGDLSGWAYKARNGELYVIGTDGITRFHPDSLRVNTFIPPIVITAFRKFELPTPFGREIRLHYTENFISFEFAALSYTSPERNQYAYKLEGLDRDWVYSGSRRYAGYPHLEPGEYIFRVKGSNSEGVWNEEGTSIAVIIRPPPWKTIWAYILYGIVLAGALLSIRRYQINKLLARHHLEVSQLEAKTLREVDHMKSRFFANISHEFRTPLTLIEGPAKQLLSGEFGGNPQEQYGMIVRNSQRLLRLVNQLLDLSKLEAGRTKLEVTRSDMVEIVRGTVASFESLAKSRNILFTLHEPGAPFLGYCDRDKVEKILTNLISNAFKFTAEGGNVSVTIALRRDVQLNAPTRGDCVEIVIHDTGTGIPQDEIEKVFDRFYQVDDSQTRQQEGTGIGLALVKELVELHKGKITVMSEQGKGSTFTLQLPISQSHFHPEEIVVSEATERQRTSGASEEIDLTKSDNKERDLDAKADAIPILLIIEDNADMRSYIRKPLEQSFNILEAENGDEGIAKAIERIPDLIVSDVMMPGLSGFDVCNFLKENERTSHIPIIMLTAKAEKRDKLEGLKTGADDYLVKPFDTEELRIRITNLIEQRRKLRERFSVGQALKPGEVAVKSIDDVFLQKVLSVIEAHMGNEKFSVEELAREVNMSRSQLHRKLTALTNQSPNYLLRYMRLHRAKQLLEQNAGTVSEIAFQVGFGTVAHFSKTFREQFGVVPSAVVDNKVEGNNTT